MVDSSSPQQPLRSITQTGIPFGLIALMFAISVLSLMIYDRLRFQPIMTVDVEAILQHKLDQLQTQNSTLKQDQMVLLSQQWAQQLASEVASLSSEYNAIVLVRPAVVQGSIDMTEHLLIRLNGTRP